MNDPGILIKDVTLQIDKSTRHIEGKVQIIITLKNNSKTLDYYVLKRPRIIDYDRGSRTLSIGLYEKDQSEDAKVSAEPFAPEQITIPAGTTFQWQYLLPLWLKKITRPPGAREVVDVLDISDVQKLACTIAYHTSPFQFNPSDKQGEALTLSKWGEMVSADFERTIIK